MHNFPPLVTIKWSEVSQLCPTLCNPVDCRLPGSSIHGIFQARVLEWVATSFSRGSSWPRDQTLVSRIVGGFFTVWATREEIQWRLGHFLNLMIKHCLLNLGLSKIILNSKKDLIFTRNIILYSILVTSISHGWPPDYSWYLPVSRNATTQLSQS